MSTDIEKERMFIVEQWSKAIVNQLKNNMAMMALFPDEWKQWVGVKLTERLQCNTCGNVGNMEIFNTESFQDMNATIEIHRIGCGKCGMVGEYGYDDDKFRLITDFEEWVELTGIKKPPLK